MNFCVDIGGTNTKIAIISDNYEIVKHEVLATPKKYSELIELIECKYVEHGIDSHLYISCPSAYSFKERRIVGVSALEYITGKDLLGDLKHLNKVHIENDANCSLYGEFAHGNAKNTESSAMFTVGTGVGGSFLINEKIYDGANNMSGEFGYMLIDNELNSNHYRSLGGKSSVGELLKACQLIDSSISSGMDAFDSQNEKVIDALEKMVTYLAIGIINIQYIIDPEIIIIGGAISTNESFEKLLNKATKKVLDMRPNYKLTPNIKMAKLGNEAHLFGALYKGKKEQ